MLSSVVRTSLEGEDFTWPGLEMHLGHCLLESFTLYLHFATLHYYMNNVILIALIFCPLRPGVFSRIRIFILSLSVSLQNANA